MLKDSETTFQEGQKALDQRTGAIDQKKASVGRVNCMYVLGMYQNVSLSVMGDANKLIGDRNTSRERERKPAVFVCHANPPQTAVCSTLYRWLWLSRSTKAAHDTNEKAMNITSRQMWVGHMVVECLGSRPLLVPCE